MDQLTIETDYHAEPIPVRLTINYNDIQDSAIVVYRNTKQDTAYRAIGTISAYPKFIDTSSGDYNIPADSPCRDADDPDSSLDPDNTRVDIGAFFYPQPLGIQRGNRSPQYSVHLDGDGRNTGVFFLSAVRHLISTTRLAEHER
jgi:hypothetical protein